MSTRRIHECGDAPAFALAPQWILWVWRPCPAPPSSPTPGAGCWGVLASCTARANLADALFVAHCRGMQPSCRVDQPVDFTGALRPVPHGGLVGEVEPLPCDLRMIKRGGVAMAGRDDPPDAGGLASASTNALPMPPEPPAITRFMRYRGPGRQGTVAGCLRWPAGPGTKRPEGVMPRA